MRSRTILFSEIADDALKYSKAHKRSYRDDVTVVARLKEWFGAREAESLTPSEIEKCLTSAAAENKWAPSTYNHYRGVVMLCYREGRRASKVHVNPARDVRHQREDNSRVRFLSDAEEKKLCEVIQSDYLEHMPEFEPAINTGLRKGSMYGLTWSMIDWSGRMLNIPTSKNGEPIHIPLNAAALAALKAVYQQGSTGRVFESAKTGMALQNSRHWFEKALTKAEIVEFHWHDLRHCFATKLRMTGAKLEDIGELLGHKGLQMTKRYAHIGPNQLHDVVAQLDATVSTTAARKPEPEPVVSVRYLN